MTGQPEPAEAAEPQSLTWHVVRSVPGSLVEDIALAAAPTRPHIHKDWQPSGAPDEAAPPPGDEHEHTALEYAGYIGRVGLLAVALGVGATVSGATGVARAEPADSDSASATESAESTTTESEAAPTAVSKTAAESSTGETPGSAVESIGEGPTTVVSSSGGAITSTRGSADEGTSESLPGVATSSGGAITSTWGSAEEGAVQSLPGVATSSGGAVISDEGEITAPESAGAESVLLESPEAPASEAAATEAPAPVPAAGAGSEEITDTLAPEPTSDTSRGDGGSAGTAAPRTVTVKPSLSAPTKAPAVELSPVSDLAASAPAEAAVVEAAPADTQPAAALSEAAQIAEAPATSTPTLVNRVLTTVLAPFSPAAATTPAAQTAQTTVVWGVLAWVRRTYFNQTPDLTHQEISLSLNAGEPSDPIAFLGSDGDAGDILTYKVPAEGQPGGPTNGTVTVNPDGTFSYTPAADWDGVAYTDQFTVTVDDGASPWHIHGLRGLLSFNTWGHTDTDTVTLHVTVANVAPVAVDDTDYAVNEDTTLTVDAAHGVLANDIDAEGGPLSAVLLGDAQHGDLVLNADGSFTYTPDPDWSGSDTFTYQAVDPHEAASNAAIVTVTVNAAPVAADDTDYAVNEDTTLTVDAAHGVLANDTDAEGGPLTASLVATPGYAQAFSLNPDGSFTYTPAPDWSGTDTFTYRAVDSQGAASNTATVTVSVRNLAPTAADDAYAVNEYTTLTVDAAHGVLANDTDPGGGPLTAQWVAGPAHAQAFTLNPDGSFTYTPAPDWVGHTVFAYQAVDAQGATSDIAEVWIETRNLPPTAADDAYAVNEDTTLTVDAAAGVLANDTDPGPLNALLLDGPAHAETFTFNTDGSFSYTPAADWSGIDTFTYRAYDGHGGRSDATVTITVGNLAPTAGDDAQYGVNEDTTLAVDAAAGVLANDTDPGGGPLTAVLVDDADHGDLVLNADGSFSYTPAADWSGTDTFTYQAKDAQGALSNTATVTVTVNPIEDAVRTSVEVGSATPTTGNVTVTLTARDPDGDPVNVTHTDPVHGTVTVVDNLDGTWTYTYDPTDAARLHAGLGGDNTDGFTVTVTDSNGASTEVPTGAIAIAPAQYSVATVAVGTNPGSVAVIGDQAYVGNGGSNTVSVIDSSNNVDTFDLNGYSAGHMAVSGTDLYVTSYSQNGLLVIDTANNNTWHYLTSVSRPMEAAVSGNNLYAANYLGGWGGQNVTKVDLTTGTTLPINTGGDLPYGVVVKGDRVYVSNSGSNTVAVISTTSDTRIGDPIPVGARPMGMAVNGDYIYVTNFNENTVSVIDTTANTVVGLPIAVGSQPVAVTVSPDGSLAYVANYGDGTVSVIDTATNTVVDLDPVDPEVVDNIQVGTNPQGVAVRPDGTVYVTNYGSNNVSVISFTPSQL